MQYVELVAILAVLQFFFFGVMTGQARRVSGLKAPAITGDEGFERMYRVQINTLETLVAFMPALLLAGKYWPSAVVASIGAVYIIGRFLYWRAYVTNPAKRAIGFILSILPTLFLILLALGGVTLSLINN